MRSTIRIALAGLVLLCATQTFGANFANTSRVTREFPIDPSGSVWIDNPIGSIDVIGGEGNMVTVGMERIITGTDQAALKEAADAVTIAFEGDTKVRLMRTMLPPGRNSHWSVAVNFIVHVPRSVNVKIGSKFAEHIRVAQVNGSVTVNGFNATLIMEGVVGASVVNLVNGRIIYNYAQRPAAKAQVQTVNADIDMYFPPTSGFEWIANTLNGDILSTFPVRAGRFTGTTFHGVVGSGGVTINTETAMGRILVLAQGTNPDEAHSMRVNAAGQEAAPGDVLRQPARKVQMPFVNGDFTFAASVADVTVGEVRGNARVDTGAGEVELGAVFGQCFVTSMGGPLNLGDIGGPLSAHTGAGDVIVRAARMGGQISTDGGLIRVIYGGGPLTLRSGGGDIIVRQASAFVDAQTTSGDVTLTGDPAQKSVKVNARTMQGNIVLNVSPRFAADIDATIVTSDPDVNEMHIDFNGITLRREKVGNKTRIHATGRINGGGERVELYAEDGDISILAATISPIRLVNPK